MHEVSYSRTITMLKTLATYGVLLAAAYVLGLTSTAVAALPDHRAYEMVSPVDKGGLSLMPNLAVTDASGEHVIVDGGAKNSLLADDASWMLEERTGAGWAGVQIGPSPAPDASAAEQASTGLIAVSEDLTRFAFQTTMPLESRISRPSLNVYTREGLSGPLAWVSGPPAPLVSVGEPGECQSGTQALICSTDRAVLAGASSDLGTLVWGQYHPLVAPPASLPGYPPDTHEHGYEVYASEDGSAQLVGLIPHEGESVCGPEHGPCVVPPCGAAMGNEGGAHPFLGGFAPIQGDVSGEGLQAIFTSPDPSQLRFVHSQPVVVSPAGCPPPEIYVRENGTISIDVSASQRASADPSGPQEKKYVGSSEENGHINTIFFISKEELTDNANTGVADEGDDLYAYSVATGKLTDLTPENNTAEKKYGPRGEVFEAVEALFLGSSTSGQLVYFTATSVLTAEPNSQGQAARPGVSNLYVYDATTHNTTFIASGAGLHGATIGLGSAPTYYEGTTSSQVTANGQNIVFVSTERLTSYDNFGAECATSASNNEPVLSPGECVEVYLYSRAGDTLVCVSCNPSGEPPVGSAHLPTVFRGGYLSAASVEPGTLPLPQAISDDGNHIFFDSPDRLTAEAPEPTSTRAPQSLATAGEFEPNVYEYEEGHVYLIAAAARVLTSTPSGNDVFFDTYAQLSLQDRDGLPDVYDARVGGGFPALAPSACSGTSCQGAPASAPIFEAPAGATFSGASDNFPPPSGTKPLPKSKSKTKLSKCKKGEVRKHNRCVRRSKPKQAKKSNRRGR